MYYLILLIFLIAGCGQTEYILEDGFMWQVDRQRDFSGGENKATLPEAVQKNQLIVAEGCYIDPVTKRLKKEGAWVATANQVANLTFSKAITYDSIYGKKLMVWGRNSSTGLDEAGLLTVQDTPSYAKLENVVTFHLWTRAVEYIDTSNDVGYPIVCYDPGTSTSLRKYSSGAASDITIGSIIDSIAVHKNMLFVMTRDGLKFSNIGVYSTFDALDIIVLPVLQMSQMVSVGDALFITGYNNRQKRSFVLYGASRFDFNLVEVPNPIDVPIGNMQLGINDGYFISDAAFCKFNTNGVSRLLTFPYPLSTKAAWNLTNQEVIFNEQLGFGYTTTGDMGASNYEDAYYLQPTGFFRTGRAASDGSTPAYFPTAPLTYSTHFSSSSKTLSEIFFVAIHNGSIKYFDNTANDTTYKFKIQTKHEDFGIKHTKLFRSVSISVPSAVSAVTLKYSLDGASLATAETRDLVAGENIFYLNNVRGETLSLEISTVNAITINELAWKYRKVGGNTP